jgi:hypothetical protein
MIFTPKEISLSSRSFPEVFEFDITFYSLIKSSVNSLPQIQIYLFTIKDVIKGECLVFTNIQYSIRCFLIFNWVMHGTKQENGEPKNPMDIIMVTYSFYVYLSRNEG